MTAQEYLTEVRTAYTNLMGMREILRAETEEGGRKTMRAVLKDRAICYSGILNEVWDTVERVDSQIYQDILIHRYIFLEPFNQIAAEMQCSVSTLYKYHARALAKVQRILDGRNRR